ncbi:formate/nitrite transporter family protein [Dankookia sp. GCM10030260]|uniref:formate/nitrite transporter family protein n=1 Tax=Dankookia sp. GCM10030260 TaxID=3273390 RepID=UPI0036234D5D
MTQPPSPEARAPEAIASQASAAGARKAGLDWPVVTVLGLLAGAYIGFGGLFATVALAGAEGTLPFGAAQVLAGVAFSLGLVLVLVGGAELFTGNTLMLVAWAEERAGMRAIAAKLGLVYLANLVGAVAVALLAFLGGVHLAGEGAVGAAALAGAQDKAALPPGRAFASGILANILVCLAVWLAWGARSAADKVLVVILPVAGFVALGLQHSVANMMLIPWGWLVLHQAGAEFWTGAGITAAAFPDLTLAGFVANLVPVTLGNILGGVLVGSAYWFAYLRDPAEADGNRTHHPR